MKANELRIGLTFYAKSLEKKEWETHSLDAFTICQAINNEINIKPIPLTEEWLLKFGFEITKASVTHNHTFSIDNFKVNNLLRGGQFWYREVELKYVHQLQNLYYALTGEELKVLDWESLKGLDDKLTKWN